MKYTLVIILLSISFIVGYNIAPSKITTQPISCLDIEMTQDELKPILSTLKNDKSPETYEKVFLMLLAKLGLQNYINGLKLPIVTVEKECKPIVQIVEKQIIREVIKKVPSPRDIVEGDFNNLKMSNNSFSRNINKILKASLLNVHPSQKLNGEMIFEVIPKNYQDDRYSVLVSSSLKHNGHFWEGDYKIVLNSRNSGAIFDFKSSGINKDIMLHKHKKQSFLLFKNTNYLIQFNLKENNKKIDGIIYKRSRKDLNYAPFGRLRQL